MVLPSKMDSIKCKKDLILFVQNLQKDFVRNHNEWNNQTIDSFLEAISAWLEDANQDINDCIGENDPAWKYIATIFLAGKMYE